MYFLFIVYEDKSVYPFLSYFIVCFKLRFICCDILTRLYTAHRTQNYVDTILCSFISFTFLKFPPKTPNNSLKI